MEYNNLFIYESLLINNFMKLLKSKFNESKWHSFKINRDYKVVPLPIDELWGSVPVIQELYNKPFRQTLKDDIEENGLVNPLLVVSATFKELKEKKIKHGDALNELPFDVNNPELDAEKMYVVWGGSQRLDVAKELGYTHIDCALIPTLDEAYSLQSEMRKDYTQTLYLKGRKI